MLDTNVLSEVVKKRPNPGVGELIEQPRPSLCSRRRYA